MLRETRTPEVHENRDVFHTARGLITMHNGVVRDLYTSLFWNTCNPYRVQCGFGVYPTVLRVTRDEYPLGIICCECGLSIPENDYVLPALPTGIVNHQEFMCMPCSAAAMDETVEVMEWDVSLTHMERALVGETAADSADGDVQMWMPTANSFSIYLNGDDGANQVTCNIPVIRVKDFVQAVHVLQGTLGTEIVQQSYLDDAFAKFEQMLALEADEEGE